MSLLREGLLEDRAVALAAAPPELGAALTELGAALTELGAALTELGARVEPLEVAALGEEEDQVGAWARERAPLTAVVFDARGLEMTAALESAWIAVREVAVGALIPTEVPGKVVTIAPDAGPVAAGLENLARTLSVEWARYGITTVTVAMRSSATEAELAELVCFLCSRGGEYFSGCRLDLGAPGLDGQGRGRHGLGRLSPRHDHRILER